MKKGTKIKESEVAMVNAASTALKILNKDSLKSTEEIIQEVVSLVRAKTEAKIAAISAADQVIKMKRQNPSLSDREAIERAVKKAKLGLEVVK
jgi:hypothetical protein